MHPDSPVSGGDHTSRGIRVAALAVSVLFGVLASCGDNGAGSTTVTLPTSGETSVTSSSQPPSQATTAATPDLPPGGSALESIDPCALLGEEDFGIFVDAGVPGVEDDLSVPDLVRQCTWEGTLNDDFYTGLSLQVHAQSDISAITFDAEPTFVVLPIDGRSLPGVAVVSAPNPDVVIEESVSFVAFDAGDVLVALLPWASVFPGTAEFEALLDVALGAANRVSR